jgi:peptidyl-prolyl cis-trans isomerase C
MTSLRKSVAPQIAALILLALSASPALAQDTPAPAKDTSANQPAISKEAPKGAPTDVLVRVNGTAITRLEVDRAVKVMLAQAQGLPEELPTALLQQARQSAQDQLVLAELLYQEASKTEVKDLDKMVADKLAANRAKFATEAEFETALKGVEMTQKDLQEFTRKDLVISNFVEKRFVATTKISDAEVKNFYDENLTKLFSTPETVQASHILVGIDEKATGEELKKSKDKAKEKAEALLKKIKAGEDFAALAKSDSSCPSKDQGGDLGSFGRGQMVEPFEKAAFALKVGEVSGIVETQFGYHIIKLTGKQAASTESLEGVKGQISTHLLREQTKKNLADLVAKLKASAKIENL